MAGILWMLFVTGTTLSVPSLVGSIMSIGVATANSILLVTFANDERALVPSAQEAMLSAGYARVRVDGTMMDLEEALSLELDKQKKHTIEVVVDRLVLSGARLGASERNTQIEQDSQRVRLLARSQQPIATRCYDRFERAFRIAREIEGAVKGHGHPACRVHQGAATRFVHAAIGRQHAQHHAGAAQCLAGLDVALHHLAFEIVEHEIAGARANQHVDGNAQAFLRNRDGRMRGGEAAEFQRRAQFHARRAARFGRERRGDRIGGHFQNGFAHAPSTLPDLISARWFCASQTA